jgi:gibberellin 2beta-dioxygenase
MPAFAGGAAEPPLADSYYALLRRGNDDEGAYTTSTAPWDDVSLPVAECELPMIDVGCLTSADHGSSPEAEAERAACAAAIARAAEEWGFFQVRNHGVPQELLEEMRREQARLFRLPFETKATAGLLNDSYRWGTPTATSPRQLSWSEAFHVPLAGVSGSGTTCDFGDLTTLRFGSYVYVPRPGRRLLFIKGVFVWDYNLPRLYNPTTFELTLSSKIIGLYNLGRL